MSNDMQLIKKLEKEIDKKLNQIKLDEIGGNENGYSMDGEGHVNGLNLDGLVLKTPPPILFQFLEIKSLSLHANMIEDINGLDQLKQLKKLWIGSNQLTSLSGIEGLTGLTDLDLRSNQLTALSGIEGLTGLTTLNLTNNQLTALSGIEGLTGLTNLNLSYNQLTALSGIEGLTGLTTLNIGGNRLTALSGIEGLTGLTTLYIGGNQLTALSGIEGLTGLTTLYLNNNQLTSLSGIEGLTGLTTLKLDNNKLTALSGIEGLTGLTALDLSGNQLTSLSGIEGLTGLTHLYIGGNQLTSLSGIEGLTGLKRLLLIGNQIKKIPEPILQWDLDFDVDIAEYYRTKDGTIYLHGNPIEEPPIEILKQGKDGIRHYLKELEKQAQLRLNEVKVLLVGDGGAGKTSLMKRLMGLDFDEKESQTHGINIEKWAVENENHDIRVNLWDFGGQEIMHATHQFFLSKRSLYILVLDGRRDEKPEYWLKHIRSFGKNSPVLVVINKTDENPGFKLNEPFLREKYDNIIGFHRISCKTGDGFDDFKNTVQSSLNRMEMIRITWPANWFEVKKYLEKMEEPYINYSRYQNLCKEQNVTNKNFQVTLVEFLNDLGIIIYFLDPHLKHMQVLKPRWLTGGVYKIINSPILAEQNGVLNLNTLEQILDQKDRDDYCFPLDCHIYIVKLMEKFELCYFITPEQILIPDLLDEVEPEFQLDNEGALTFILEYGFLPRSIMPRFIVNRHKGIKDNLQWRTGVVLHDEQFKSTAVVKVDYEARRIYIRVFGQQKRDYFAVVLATLRKINSDFDNLDTKELIPMPDDPNVTVSYKHLLRLEKNGIVEYLPGESEKEYNVKNLLGTVTPDSPTLEDIYKILLKLVDENDTEESVTRKLNGIISWQPTIPLTGIKIDGTKASDWLIEKVLNTFGKKKRKN